MSVAVLIRTFLGLMVFAVSLAAVEEGVRPLPMSDDPVVKEKFFTALDLHQEGVAGDEDAVLQAQEILEELLILNPDDARVQVFLGNLYVLRARDAVFYRKMKWLKKGGATLDAAVVAAPEDPNVRSVRAVNSYMLPRVFGRRDIAEEDFSVLLDWAETDPARYTDSLLRFVYFHAGQFYGKKDEDKGRALLDRALNVPADSVSDEQIREAIEDLS